MSERDREEEEEEGKEGKKEEGGREESKQASRKREASKKTKRKREESERRQEESKKKARRKARRKQEESKERKRKGGPVNVLAHPRAGPKLAPYSRSLLRAILRPGCHRARARAALHFCLRQPCGLQPASAGGLRRTRTGLSLDVRVFRGCFDSVEVFGGLHDQGFHVNQRFICSRDCSIDNNCTPQLGRAGWEVMEGWRMNDTSKVGRSDNPRWSGWITPLLDEVCAKMARLLKVK